MRCALTSAGDFAIVVGAKQRPAVSECWRADDIREAAKALLFAQIVVCLDYSWLDVWGEPIRVLSWSAALSNAK